MLAKAQIELLDFCQTIDEARDIIKALPEKTSLALSLKTKLEILAHPLQSETPPDELQRSSEPAHKIDHVQSGGGFMGARSLKFAILLTEQMSIMPAHAILAGRQGAEAAVTTCLEATIKPHACFNT